MIKIDFYIYWQYFPAFYRIRLMKTLLLASIEAYVGNEWRHSVQITHGQMGIVTHGVRVIVICHGGREGQGRVASLHFPLSLAVTLRLRRCARGLPPPRRPFSTPHCHHHNDWSPFSPCWMWRCMTGGTGSRQPLSPFFPYQRKVRERCGHRGRLRRFLDFTFREKQAMTISLIHQRQFLTYTAYTRTWSKHFR